MSRLKKEDIFNKKNVILAVLIVATVITSIVILNNKETALKGILQFGLIVVHMIT